MNGEARVLIAGGGTGGHLMPALALARELTRGPNPAIVFLVGSPRGPDREILSASGFSYRLLSAPAVERRRWWRNAALPATLPRALAVARRVVTEFGPHVVVGTGGYASVPVGMAAGLGRVPLLLQEQNRTPGLATRLLARWASRICVQFPETVEALAGRSTVEVTGSPIDSPAPEPADFAGRLDPGRPTVGVFGGSQGARAINDLVLELFGTDPQLVPNVVWQTGRADLERVRAAAAPWPERVVIRDFFTPMAAVYPLLDAIVCRAGAMTLAEITAWGIPSILIPYPYATDDHQAGNARAMEGAGAAFLLLEAEATPRRLGNLFAGLLSDAPRRREMAAHARRLGRPDAARRVADRVLELAGVPA